MFGGLELKGNGSKDEEDTPAAAPAASGFGFLNATPATEAAPPAEPPSSSFSFLNSATAAPDPAPAPESAMTSGFSFMSTSAAPEPAAETTPETTSGFSFLTSPPAAEAPTPSPAPAPADPSPSGFDFLMSTTTTSSTPPIESSTATPADIEPEPPVPPVESVAATAPTMSVSSTTSTSTSSSSLPAGAGITFGTAAKQGGVKKKKKRAARIGMGAPPAPAPAPFPVPAKQSTPAPAPAPVPTPAPTMMSPDASARDDAEAAARRAEEFMTQKSMEQAQAAPAPAPVEVPNYDSVDNSDSNDLPEIDASLSTDSVIYKAQKAAEEAKALSKQQQQQQTQKSFMGTFFKGFGGTSKSQPVSAPASKASSVDRLAKQQKDMKRAMAEREMKLHQPKIQEDDDDDDDVVVSTRAGGYLESLPIPSSSAAITPSNSISSHFQPAKPPAPRVVKEKALPPKRQKTPQEVFEEYQALFAQSVHKAMEQVENVRSTQKMLLEERFVAMAKESLSTQQIAQVEAQLQVAVEEEDYELADQLGQVADAHKREKTEVSMMLDANIKALEHLDSQKTLVIKGVASCFQNLAVRLTELQKKEEAADTNDIETLKQFEVISKQLSAEQERLQQDSKHLERDEQLVGEERKELEVAISEQSGAIEEQRDDVKLKLSEVEIEVEELRKKLEEKQKIAAALRTEMHGYEDSISKVRTKFSRQLNRVDKKEQSLQENRKEWETEQKAYQEQKEAHDLQVQTHSEAMLAHDELMKTLESELKLTDEFAEMIPSKLGFFENASKEESKEENDEGDLAQLQADVVKCEAAASEAKVVLKAASTAISKLESEHAILVSKIPALEAEKKAAASKRDFKGASKASKEIKDATARLKECEEELVGESASRKNAAEKEVERLNVELEKARKVANEKEKLSGQNKMAILAKEIEQLRETQEEVCGDVTSSENSVRGVGALVLEGQIKSLKLEGENLGSKYGGWDELLGEGEVEEETQDAEVESEEISGKETPAQDDGLSRKERIMKVRQLMTRIQEAEESLEAAAEREDFDEAAELHEVFQTLQSELETINLSDEDMEIALSNEEVIDTDEEKEPLEPASDEDMEIALSNEEVIDTDEEKEPLEPAEANGDVAVEESDPIESEEEDTKPVEANGEVEGVPDAQSDDKEIDE